MKAFSDFVIEDSLNESLNSAQEYYMTDDTVMPSEIYAAFSINEKPYVIALVQTKVEGVYILQAGKNTGNKTLWWRFHDSGDIVPVLSTVLHFAESSMFMLGPKIKGVAIQIQTAASIDRAVRMAELMIKKTFITTMKYVPLIQPPESDKDYITYQKLRFVFFVKKNVDVHGLFKGSEFNKYDFTNIATGPIPAAAAPKVSVPVKAVASLKPKKIVKAKTSVTPSSKYTFNNFEVETPHNVKDIEKINTLTSKFSGGATIVSTPTPSTPTYGVSPKMPAPDITLNTQIAGAMEAMPVFASLVGKLKTFGFDESKLNWNDFKYLLNNITTAAEKEILSSNYLYPFSDTNKNQWISAMSGIADNHKFQLFSKGSAFYKTKENVEKFLKQHTGAANLTKPTPTPIAKTTAAIDIPFKGTLKGSGKGSVAFDVSNVSFKEIGFKLNVKEDHLSDTLGYYNKVGNLKNFSYVRDYSGSNYSSYNDPLRTVVSKLLNGHKLSKSEISEVVGEFSHIPRLYSAFEEIDPVPESFWVYRGTYIPSAKKSAIVSGYDFVDPAFLSTSISPDKAFSGDKLAIFVPKGSKVIPLLKQSKLPNEAEILLPPASVLRVIDAVPMSFGSSSLAIRTVYMGSAHKNILETLKKKLTEETAYANVNVNVMKRIIEAMTTKTQKEIANSDKFTNQHDVELSKAISDAIQSGKLKLTK